MLETKIVVVVRDGCVQSIFNNGDPVSVEVVDLDRPSFETPEEELAFDEAESYIDLIGSDPGWSKIY